ncbi:hypothetical protein SAMN05421780_11915 [Flexibacter flexilis DSM 6793]|uniref:Uncharacterized protein n=1 Tax=Flexibacter flexilis DSM 6793 TaxID=927664 RepID=A0A1I1NT08_9BACT|nr:hypothetical protein SAMN05421780_11915 [Flexibacter flexilis DSM 6793]
MQKLYCQIFSPIKVCRTSFSVIWNTNWIFKNMLFGTSVIV